MKLNIGSHNKRIEGYVSVDILELENVDYVCDITKTPWYFKTTKKGTFEIDGEKGNFSEAGFNIGTEMVEEILMVEVLEHISFRKTDEVLREIYRVLQPGGRLIVQVPDCGKMMEAYAFNKISEVIPHKPESEEQVLKLREETGYVVNPNRWLFAFCGAQKHPYDAHLNIFTKERLEEYLENAGFSEIKFLDDTLEWKIKAVATK